MEHPPSTSTLLELRQIRKQFQTSRTPAIDNLSLQLQQGDILTLLGPSGCGKTTLLRLIAGFETPDRGTIVLNQQVVAQPGRSLPPEQRGVGMVFQDYALFPHLTVAANVGFGLQRQGKSTVNERVQMVLHLVGLEHLGHRYPYQLSGGQQQRVALARALAPRPALVLLDEPLSNLDVQVRLRLRQELRRILKAAGTSAIFVTHDQEEALAISDQVGVINQGCLEQLDRPEVVYQQPRSRFVAEFVTQANFLPAHRQGEQWRTVLGDFALANAIAGERADIMIRPEAITLHPDPDGIGTITEVQFLGRSRLYTVALPEGQSLQVQALGSERGKMGMAVAIEVRASSLYGFVI
ncbi:MAG: ABC transporter ATP-binding protein [Spirulina sp. SIO3F2]|nr:ABC transporter ATP-binding protein [Spirulina sp. SIO3F2]